MRNHREKTGITSGRILYLFLGSLLLVGVGGCHRRVHSAAPLPNPAPAEISVWESPLHATPEVTPAVWQQKYRAVMQHAGFELHSHYLYQTVEIPLIIRHSHAYVQADWSGRQIECMIDTGANTIMWPQWMHLDSLQLGFASNNSGAQGEQVRGEWMLSPHITLGDLRLTNVPTEAMGVPRPTAFDSRGVPTDPNFEFAQQPILGIFAFVPAVTTIDYGRKTLTLRNTHYDVTRQAHIPHTLLLHYTKGRTGRVILSGTLGGHKTRFLLDTGDGWASVSSAFAHDHFPTLPIKTSDPSRLNGGKALPYIGHLSMNIGGLKYKALDLYVVKEVGEADVYLGMALFRACRVTVDPFRQVVLLESSRYDPPPSVAPAQPR